VSCSREFSLWGSVGNEKRVSVCENELIMSYGRIWKGRIRIEESGRERKLTGRKVKRP